MSASLRRITLTVMTGCVAALLSVGPGLTSRAVAAPALALSPSTGKVGPGGTVAFKASGGKSPYAWTLATNASGATLSASGAYKAGPTAGVTDVVQVTDATGATATATVTVGGTMSAPAGETSDGTIRPPTQ